MALNPTTIRDEIRKFADPLYAGFVAWPTSTGDATVKWGEAIRVYFLQAAVPASSQLVDPTHAGAKAAFVTAFVLVAATPDALTVRLPAALVAYAAQMLALPAAGVATPPAIPPIFVPPLGAATTALDAATQISTIIDTWARTGLFQVAGGPPPPPAPWS